MITKLESPESVFAMRVEGKITGEEIKHIEHLLEKYITKYGDLRLYIELINFGYNSAEAFWEDIKAEISYLGKFKKIALATEKEWIGKMSNFLGKITPIEIRVFHLNDRDKVYAWLSEK